MKATWQILSILGAGAIVGCVVAYERLRRRARAGDKAIGRIVHDAFAAYDGSGN